MIVPKQILDKVQEKTGATPEETTEVLKAFSSFVVKIIRLGTWEGVRIMGFGVFAVNANKLKKLKELGKI